MLKKWETLMVTGDIKSDGSLIYQSLPDFIEGETTWNPESDLGQLGWELVTVHQNPDSQYYTLWYKRPIVNTESNQA